MLAIIFFVSCHLRKSNVTRQRMKTSVIWVIYKLLIVAVLCGSVCGIYFIINKLRRKEHTDKHGRFIYPLETLPNGDYYRLNNLTGFEFIILNQICNYDFHEPWVIILVVSATDHFRRRDMIRRTWGGQLNGPKVAFVLGVPSHDHIQAKIQEESDTRHDIIQGAFQDTYRNLTYKHIMILKFVTYHCQQAKYIVKMDDDSFLSIGGLLDLINNIPRKITTNLLICRKVRHEQVRRNPRLQWFVTKEDYPYDFYPPYCMDFGFIYTGDVVYRLYAKAQVAKLFWISDIFVTGILAAATNIEQIDLSESYEFRSRRREPCDLLFGDINLSSAEILTLHLKAQRAQHPCTYPIYSLKLASELHALHYES